jgi:hypothetical protein
MFLLLAIAGCGAWCAHQHWMRLDKEKSLWLILTYWVAVTYCWILAVMFRQSKSRPELSISYDQCSC